MSERPVIYDYAVSGNYDPTIKQMAVRYNDPDLRIQWPFRIEHMIISQKDQKNPYLRDLFPEKFKMSVT